MSRRRTRAAERAGDERGFTLLELMISLSLLAVMLAMAYSVFATGMNAVPRGEAIAERSARLRAATSILSRQVHSMVNYPAHNDQDEEFPYFIGNSHYFQFITASPQHAGGEGLAWVTYWSDDRNFWLAERLIFSSGVLTGTAPDPSGQALLLDGLHGTKFQYLHLEGEESEWRDSWDGSEDQNLPGAIRVVIDGLGLGETYWIQEIPVMVVAYGLGQYDPENMLHQPDTDNGEGGGEDQ
jgi:prepilin-type N-terminal cleavage/methylation domain-containing protein